MPQVISTYIDLLAIELTRSKALEAHTQTCGALIIFRLPSICRERISKHFDTEEFQQNVSTHSNFVKNQQYY
jgi:hypothetical protein